MIDKSNLSENELRVLKTQGCLCSLCKHKYIIRERYNNIYTDSKHCGLETPCDYTSRKYNDKIRIIYE